jgi:hypothetical protein
MLVIFKAQIRNLAKDAKTMTNTDEQLSAEDGIAANIAQIAEAVNTMNLDKYGSSVTADFVNMNKNLLGQITSTVSRQARLDALKMLFESSPYTATASMKPSEIYFDGDRGFARVDGSLKMTAKEKTDLSSYTLTLDLYLSFHKVEGHGWQSERSMGIETSRTDD